MLPVPKLFFGYARDLTALYPFGVGGAGIVFPERTTPERIFELVAEHRPTILVNVPTMMAPDGQPSGRRPRRTCPACACARPPARRCHASCTTAGSTTFGVEVLDGIGSCELYHIYISNRPGRARPGAPASSCRATRPSSTRPASCSSPATRPRSSTGATTRRRSSTFNGDTVRTGDLFERDEDGFFWYRGRVDDLIKVGGIWVAPAEIEHCLVGHPDVVECAVVGAAQNGLTIPRAYVVVRQPARGAAHSRTSCASGSRRTSTRARSCFVDDLPKTPSGQARPQGARSVSRVVVVTGGAKGIGKAVAERFAGDQVACAGPRRARRHRRGAGDGVLRAPRPRRRARQQRRHRVRRAARPHDARRLARAPRRERDRRLPLHARRRRRHDRARRWPHRHRRLRPPGSPAPATPPRTPRPSTPRSV